MIYGRTVTQHRTVPVQGRIWEHKTVAFLTEHRCLLCLQWDAKSLVMGSLWAGIWPNPAGWSAVLREWTLPRSVQEEWLGTAKLWPHWRRWGVLWPFHRYSSASQMRSVSPPHYLACSAGNPLVQDPAHLPYTAPTRAVRCGGREQSRGRLGGVPMVLLR